MNGQIGLFLLMHILNSWYMNIRKEWENHCSTFYKCFRSLDLSRQNGSISGDMEMANALLPRKLSMNKILSKNQLLSILFIKRRFSTVSFILFKICCILAQFFFQHLRGGCLVFQSNNLQNLTSA